MTPLHHFTCLSFTFYSRIHSNFDSKWILKMCFYIFIHVLPKNIRFTIHIVKFSAEFKGRLSRFFFHRFWTSSSSHPGLILSIWLTIETTVSILLLNDSRFMVSVKFSSIRQSSFVSWLSVYETPIAEKKLPSSTFDIWPVWLLSIASNNSSHCRVVKNV